MSYLKKHAAKFAGAAVGLSSGLVAAASHAAADAELVNAGTTVATSVKENGIAVLVAVIPVIILVPLVIWAFRKTMGLAGIRGR